MNPAYADEKKDSRPTEETDRVIVTMKKGETAASLEGDAKTLNVPDSKELVSLEVPEDTGLEDFIDELESDPTIERVEPDHLIDTNYKPNDPLYSLQYHHELLNSERAWEKTQGSEDVTVAVLDDGFDLNHPDFQGQGISAYYTATQLSTEDHGTHVAGIIGASINNWSLGAGVAPNADMMLIDVFETDRAYSSDVIEGIYLATDAGADIINMSLGSYYYNWNYEFAIQYAHQNGVLVIASAGNDSSSSTHYPSGYSNVVSVGSTDRYDQLSWFSNYGLDQDITAPGSNIWSTTRWGGFEAYSGTSMASPIVAGVAALVKSNEPQLTNVELEERLYSTAVDLGTNGWDINYGHGRVDAAAALKIIDINTPDISAVYDYSTEITGSLNQSIENGTITVRNNKEEIVRLENYNGQEEFSLAIPKQPADSFLTLTVTDKYGNTSDPLEIWVMDGTAPEAPAVDTVTDKSTNITGKGEAYGTVFAKAGNQNLGSKAIDSQGKFTLPVAKQKAGTKIQLYVTDAAGNEGPVTEVKVQDVTAPEIIEVEEVTEQTTTVTGHTEKSAEVILTDAKNVKMAEATADANGKFSFPIAKQKAGTVLYVTAEDAAGNRSDKFKVVVADTAAPDMPIVEDITDQSTKVTGKAEAASKVIVKAGTTEIGSVVTDADGKFSVGIVKQKAGVKLSITATDATGNISKAAVLTVKDVTSPTKPIVDPITDKSSTVTGKAEANSLVTVKAGAQELGSTTAKADGIFSIEIDKQQIGAQLTVTAKDTAGNISAETKITVAKAAPETTERISGSDRYKTAIAISQEGWNQANTIVLATAGDFPDALAGGPLAYQEDAPILLTKTKTLTAETKQEIQRLKAKKVIILGSAGAVSQEVESELKRMGLSVERVGGKTRFETAALIAGKMNSKQAVVANGLNFPDVLSVSSYAAKNGVPILLTRTDRLPDETKSALSGVSSTYVIGSTSVVSKSVYDTLPKPTRYGGKDRYETGYEVATKLKMSTDKAFIATGSNFPDALAGSVLAAKNDAPILLVRPTAIPDATDRQLAAYSGFSIFGGGGAVSEDVKDLLDRSLKNN
ncbi:Ig-like domain-containing protein [Planococcus plakortidis]